MDVIEKKQLSRKEALSHWYYKSKYALIKRWISNLGLNLKQTTLVDVGCGEGLFLEMLGTEGILQTSNLFGIEPAQQKTHAFYRGEIKVKPKVHANDVFDTMLIMDVLEHLQNDYQFLKNILLHLSDSGHLFITVPAHEWMWSSHDKYLGHKRRYSLKTLENLLKKFKNLEIKNLYYFYAPVFPAAALIRLCRKNNLPAKSSDMKRVPSFINKILLCIECAEVLISKKNKIAGLSVIAECKKI